MAGSSSARKSVNPSSPVSQAQADTGNQVTSRAREGRREVMERVTDFLMKHDVTLTGPNLATIVAGLSGADPGLGRILAARETAQEPISQSWLDEVGKMRSREDERADALEKLLDKVETSLGQFAQTTQNAQSETSEHRGAINDQITKLSQTASAAGAVPELDRLVDLSRVMLERIVQVEESMKKSQAETAELKASLAEARAEANVDHLTRLPNRRAFENELKKSAELCEAKKEPLTVGFCDVDHFKKINDTHGHDAGDRVLVAIARTMQNYSGKQCYAARHGGEEFALLFPGLSLDDATARLNEIRMDLGSRQMVNRDNGKSFGKITFSGGVASVHSPEDAREALARADAALYKAKETGRNQVCSGEED